MTLGNPKRITIWGCGSGTMFAAPPSPALTGPGSLAPAVRVLPFRHRLPPIVAVESRSVNDGADGRGRRHRSRDPARARQRGPAPRRPPSGPRWRGDAGQAIGLVGLLRRDHLIPQVSLDQRTIAARRISPSAAAAGDQPRDVAPGQPVARALSEDHLTAALMQDLHEIRGSGVT